MLANYLKLAVKVLLRRKFFTAISLFGISFTLVVLMVATAVLDHMVAPLAPETRQDRTLSVYDACFVGEHIHWHSALGFALLDRYVRNLPGVERMSIFSYPGLVNSYLNGSRIQSSLKRTDGEFWKILDFEFLEGGPFSPDDVEKARFVTVINATTRRRFFGDASALGQTIETDGQRFQVVGVVPDVPELRTVPFADVWVPLTTAKSDAYRRELMGGFAAMFLAASRADLPLIKEGFRARMKTVELPRQFQRVTAGPETPLERAASRLVGQADGVVNAHGSLLGSFGRETGDISLARFWAAAGLLSLLFMLLPTLNLVNLSVSRILERASEIGVRKAFGASSRTLVAQFVVENVVLTVVGGTVGFVLSRLVLDALGESGLLTYTRLSLNGRVFLYGLALAVFFGVLSGAYPAWRMSRLHPMEALKGSAR
ncbi:MAG TPA: ABC transporter permease [Planctomycetota bacterium]|nr:ABC transporter permease [Planctomycetota bacterium]